MEQLREEPGPGFFHQETAAEQVLKVLDLSLAFRLWAIGILTSTLLVHSVLVVDKSMDDREKDISTFWLQDLVTETWIYEVLEIY